MSHVQDTGVRGDVRTGIVAAAARVLREQGSHAVTTRGVAEASGVQAPTIYRLFGDKDGLIDAVAEHVMAAHVAAEAVSAAEASGDPVADLRTGWRTQMEFGLANPELYALLSARGRSAPSPTTAAGVDILRTLVRRLAAAGLLRMDEERVLAMMHAAGTGTVLALLRVPPEARDPGLSDAMFDALTRSILTSSPATPDTTVRTVAVTFGTVLPALPALTDAERALMAEWLARSIARLQSPQVATARRGPGARGRVSRRTPQSPAASTSS